MGNRVSITRESVIAALFDVWELDITSRFKISSFLTARSKRYYRRVEEVAKDLEQLNDKDLSKLFGSVFSNEIS